jgi:hypothetical protein
MNSIMVCLVVFVSIFAAAVAGMAFRRFLPEHYLGSDAKEVVRLSTGLVATMAALVLGMLVSSAKASYDEGKNEVVEMSSEIVNMDRLLAKYGPETGEMRAELRQMVEAGLVRIWPSQTFRQSELRPEDHGEILLYKLEHIAPRNDVQAAVKAQAISLVTSARHNQWLMFLKSKQSAVSTLLLVVLVSWLAAIFASFGLFSPANPAIVVTLALTALAVSSAIFMMLEMYTPFGGVMRIAPTPILEALREMGR